VACCAELLAMALKAGGAAKVATIEPSEAFLAGLLHDLGKVALDAALPKSFGRVVEAVDLLRGNIADVERTVIGLDHMVVGKRLAERWGLPATLRDCVWLHGQLPQALPATVRNPRLVNLITLADILVRERHIGYSGNYSFTFAQQNLVEAIGLTPEHVNDAVQKLVEHIEPRAKALGLGQSSSHELYQHALTQANKELGRVSGQLAAKNRRLAIRAKFFDALSGFQGELRADAPPQDVLKAIGNTAVGVLDVTSCATFSILPGQAFAEALLFDSAGDVFESTLIDCPNRPSRPPAGDGPVLAAGEQLEWLLDAVSPRLGHEKRYWICLEADNQCIGGVLWGGMPGESQRLSTQGPGTRGPRGWLGLGAAHAQIREEARTLSEQLAEANRQLHNAQTEILRSKTMISVGEMAAGAAHEMNNPLAVILGRSQLLSSQLTDAKLKASAHLIYEQSHRLTDIITELMDFAKPGPAEPRAQRPCRAYRSCSHDAKMHVDPADRSIEVTVGDLPMITVDKQQVTAALTEVIDNALHATDPTKGHIAIHAAFDPYSLRVVMTVADNGIGMDEATLKRAFDPFFSSRKAGRRRGMGLAKALRWVEASGGSIRLESRPGQGTRTMVLLPAMDRRREPRTEGERKAAQ
jgi:signal transduction histidine kinase